MAEGLVGLGGGNGEVGREPETHTHHFLGKTRFLTSGGGILGVSQVIRKKEQNMPRLDMNWPCEENNLRIINSELHRRLGASGRQKSWVTVTSFPLNSGGEITKRSHHIPCRQVQVNTSLEEGNAIKTLA